MTALIPYGDRDRSKRLLDAASLSLRECCWHVHEIRVADRVMDPLVEFAACCWHGEERSLEVIPEPHGPFA